MVGPNVVRGPTTNCYLGRGLRRQRSPWGTRDALIDWTVIDGVKGRGDVGRRP